MGCLTCKHLKEDATCDAFKNGSIPLPIKSGSIKHTKVFDFQEQDLVYEEAESGQGILSAEDAEVDS